MAAKKANKAVDVAGGFMVVGGFQGQASLDSIVRNEAGDSLSITDKVFKLA